VEGRITSYFGWRSNINDPSQREFHAGVDLSVPNGTPVKATMCGQVTEAGWSNLYGWVVSVSNGNITTLYGHNSALYVSVGDWVEKGQVIAASGNTGRSTGPHVHYGISIDGTWVDPVEAFGIG
jgi:murein DD-endopeptidase MepM/ murein hydrolase activator NlpD